MVDRLAELGLPGVLIQRRGDVFEPLETILPFKTGQKLDKLDAE